MMYVKVRKYNSDDIEAMVEIWNEVVKEGAAFPQEELLRCGAGRKRKNSRTLYPSSK